MPDCSRCGRELPLYSFHKICQQCRTAMAQYATKEEPRPFPRLGNVNAKAQVTIALIAVNAIVFLAMIFEGANIMSPGGEILARFGGAMGARSLFFEQWRLLTSVFVHAGIIHIASNMWGLWVLGDLAERIFDRWVYVALYTCCGLAGSLAAAWRNPMTGTVGASGAIFGLAGTLIAALYLGNIPIAKSSVQSILKNLLFVLGINLVYGLSSPYISNAAHIGGCVTGFALGAALAPNLGAPVRKRGIWSAAVIVGAAIILFGGYIVARYAIVRMLSR